MFCYPVEYTPILRGERRLGKDGGRWTYARHLLLEKVISNVVVTYVVYVICNYVCKIGGDTKSGVPTFRGDDDLPKPDIPVKWND